MCRYISRCLSCSGGRTRRDRSTYSQTPHGRGYSFCSRGRTRDGTTLLPCVCRSSRRRRSYCSHTPTLHILNSFSFLPRNKKFWVLSPTLVPCMCRYISRCLFYNRRRANRVFLRSTFIQTSHGSCCFFCLSPSFSNKKFWILSTTLLPCVCRLCCLFTSLYLFRSSSFCLRLSFRNKKFWICSPTLVPCMCRYITSTFTFK